MYLWPFLAISPDTLFSSDLKVVLCEGEIQDVTQGIMVTDTEGDLGLQPSMGMMVSGLGV